MAIVDFLNHALSKHAQDDLPYSVEQRWSIRQHLIDLAEEFPTLTVKVQSYTHHDGRSAQLLMAEGTLPMYYQGVKYNIPVALWLAENYPRVTPILYVVPTPDMIIKPRHSFVDASGYVHSPYVMNWTPRSNLVELCQSTSMDFGSDPPLYSKPPGWTPDLAERQPSPRPAHQPPQQPPQHSQHQQQQQQQEFHVNPMNRSSGMEAGPLQMGAQPFASSSGPKPPPQYALYDARPDYGPSHQPPQHYPASPAETAGDLWGAFPPEHPVSMESSPAQHAESSPPAQDLSAVFRERAIAALSERLHASLSSVQAAAGGRMEQLLATQLELQQRGVQLQLAAEEMAKERHALESSVIDMNTKGAQIDRWLADNEAKASTDGDIDPDRVVVAVDGLAAQALEVQAEDLAIEDTLYALQKAFQAGLLDPHVYLRQVRQLCSKQFLARALGLKVTARQHELRARPGQQHTGFGARPMNGAAPSSAVQVPVGDAWASTGMLANPLAG